MCKTPKITIPDPVPAAPVNSTFNAPVAQAGPVVAALKDIGTAKSRKGASALTITRKAGSGPGIAIPR